MLVAISLVLFSLLLIKSSELECLVSKLGQRYNSTDYYYYPIDIFASESVYKQEKSQALPCSVLDGHRFNGTTYYLCPVTKSFCPLAKENIRESLHRTSVSARSSLCIFKEKLMNKSDIVNVYVAGGSATIGCLTAGCCPAAGCNPVAWRDPTPPCTWSYRFIQWMNSTYPAHVKFINFANHGMNSVLSVELLAGAMSKEKVKAFTSNDLILLDHSVNDNGYSGFAVEHGLEMLIRKIYHRSMPYSFPTIVILDADPNPYHGFKHYPYYQVYEKIAKHYEIPVWSYRDSVLSEFSRVNQSNYHNHTNMVKTKGTHPAWHIHLFMADMYAGLLVSETDELCNLDNARNKAMYDANVRLRSRTFADLPVALSANATHMCDNELLSLSYDNVKQNLSPVGSYRFEPAVGGWNLTVDKVGRMGGFIVDHASNEGDKVVFSMNITTKEFIEKKMKFQLVIHYLRSYENAGAVSVSMCNQAPPRGTSRESKTVHHTINFRYDFVLEVIDALWTDHQTNRYSLPDKWAPELSYFPYTLCNNFTEERPTIELSFTRTDGFPRGDQKFKVLNIKVCRLDDK